MKKILKRNHFLNAGMLYIIILSLFFSFGCNRANKTLVDIGDEKITLGEFEKEYLKSVGSVDSARNKPIEDKKQFLNLYINFRLKVKDARDRGLLNSPDIQKEIVEYKKNFAPSFLIDQQVVEPELKKLYERKKEEIRASHILIYLPEKCSPQDSINAYMKADTVIQRLENGEDFGTLALEYSNDRTVLQNKGDLYYFTGGMTPDAFEDAVYNLKVGEFTDQPIRTIHGLHIIKLTDRRPRLQSIRASHILIQEKRDSLGKFVDSLETYQRALEVYNKAKSGEDFSSLVMQYSEDQGSKQNGGDLGYFDRRRLPQALDSAVFMLRIGEVAGPIKTQYGWNIIKKTDEKPIEPFEKLKESLKTEYKRTKKFKDDYQKYIESLKNKYDFKVTEAGFSFLRTKLDSVKTISDYNMDSLFNQQEKNTVIAEFDEGKIVLQDLLNFLNVNRDYQRTPLTKETVTAIINAASEQSLLNTRAEDLNIEKDDEFVAAITDYENSLLVFKVSEEELRTQVKLSENELLSFYDANKSKYTKADSTGENVLIKTFDEARAEISNELQQVRYKEIEKAYIDNLKNKYPVTIHEDILLEAFKE
jgi:peptidyl-prolyl cis-trans isomerase SurA